MDRLDSEDERSAQLLRRRVEADEDEWQRRVIDNDEVQSDLQAIATKIGLPDEDASPQKLDLLKEYLEALCAKYGFPAHWAGALFVRLHQGVSVTPWRVHFPIEVTYRDKWERRTPALVILPDLDVSNPFILRYIRVWQAQFLEPVPSPEPMRGNRRKKDWRPVLEWRKRHPWRTLEYISEQLHFAPATVRRKLAELESRSD